MSVRDLQGDIMGRKVTTHYNPSLGIRYFVRNTKTDEKIIGKTLSPKNAEHLPVRSNRDTPHGEEFFKMEIDGNVHKFMNSIELPNCMSEDGKWEFTGLRPNGKSISRDRSKKKIQHTYDLSELEFVSEELEALLV
jgi:hypothetical protein